MERKEPSEPQELLPSLLAISSENLGIKHVERKRLNLPQSANLPRFQKATKIQLVGKQMCEKRQENIFKNLFWSHPTQPTVFLMAPKRMLKMQVPHALTTDTVSVKGSLSNNLDHHSPSQRNETHSQEVQTLRSTCEVNRL